MPYRVITEEREGQFRGLAIFRVRSRGALWESMLTELIVPTGDSRTAGRLLRRVVRAAATPEAMERHYRYTWHRRAWRCAPASFGYLAG